MAIINEGFKPKRQADDRLPPGQYETGGFPVLAKGATPKITKEEWRLEVIGLADRLSWDWEEFNRLPQKNVVKDIHCVTKWSKFDTKWRGVMLDEIMRLSHIDPRAKYLIAYSYDDYTTNMPITDLVNKKAMVALSYNDKDITPEHGGPARLLVPHLYFWKSAKWLKKLEFSEIDRPGFWEVNGYHNYGDPWKEQRYSFD